MRRWSLLLFAAQALIGCAADDGGSEDASGGAEAGGSSGAGGTAAGAGGQSPMDGGRGGSGGGAARAGAASGVAGFSGGTAGAAGSGAGAAGADAGAGPGAGRPTSCGDPLVVEDISRLTASDAVEPYLVMGTTAYELRQSIDANRGRDYDALTTWNVAWSFRDCSAPVWTVSVDIAYSMPEWDAPSDADALLVASWLRYEDALFCHEYGHANLAIECANAVLDAFQALEGNGDCQALQSSANTLFEAVLADYLTREVTYDADTNHGATMGAVFP